MTEYLLREYRREDIPCLIELWHRVFGDPESLISEFLVRLPSFGTGAVAEYRGKAVGAAYAIDDMYIHDSLGRERRCGYIYAVAVSPEHRHQGLGEALSQRAAELSRRRGSRFLCTLPAEEALYPWYEKILGLGCALHRRCFSSAASPLLPCRELEADEYLSRREKLLESRPHMLPGRELMDFAAFFYRSFGGGLYFCGGGICAAYGDKELVIKELLVPDCILPGETAASLAAFLGREEARYYLPSPDGEMYISAQEGELPADLIWNLSFD